MIMPTKKSDSISIGVTMEDKGIGYMISVLGGNEDSAEAMQGALNKTIAELSLNDDVLHLVFEDGYKIGLFDDGQSCCEERYMRTDDELGDFVGAVLLNAETPDAPNAVEDNYGVHEIQFLHVKTSKGVFTISSHNEHNGYYGGIMIRARKE